MELVLASIVSNDKLEKNSVGTLTLRNMAEEDFEFSNHETAFSPYVQKIMKSFSPELFARWSDSLLIFEGSLVDYYEAELLHSKFSKRGLGRHSWNGVKNQLYGERPGFSQSVFTRTKRIRNPSETV